MKKTLALVMSLIMVLSVMATMSFTSSAEAETIEIEQYGCGWENWSSQTQLLIVAPIAPNDVSKAYTWEITYAGTTFSQTPSTYYDFGNGSVIWRFQTCLADDMYIPAAGTSDVITAKIYSEGELVYNAVPAEGASWDVPEDFEPITIAPVATLTPYGEGWENWTGGTGGNQTQLLIMAPIAWDATYTWEITYAGSTFSLKSSSRYDFGGGNVLWRFEPCLAEGFNMYVPKAGTTGVVTAKVYNEAGELIYLGVPAAEKSWNVPADFAPVTPAPIVEIKPYSAGWENWTGGTGGTQTQLLITAPIVPDATTTEYTFKITYGDATFTQKSSSQYNFGNGTAIWRFETCLGEGENQFVPTAGATGPIYVEVYNGEELVAICLSAAGASWNVPADFEPIVPEPPVVEPPVDEPVTPPAQTGDAAVYATIAVAVAAVAMAVVLKRKSTI